MLRIRMLHQFLTKALFAACAVLALTAAQALAGDYEKGVSAFRRGDYAEARVLLKPLAQDGDPYAQFAIAVMYDDGLGLPQNFGRALSWYGKAAQAGLVDAQYMAGRFHGGGRGVKQSPPLAFFWFDLAAAGGHPQAPRLRDQQRSQVSPAMRPRVEDEAVKWLAAHPHQFSCRERRCIFPAWTAKPSWNPLGLE